jgi:hypothetical protein
VGGVGCRFGRGFSGGGGFGYGFSGFIDAEQILDAFAHNSGPFCKGLGAGPGIGPFTNAYYKLLTSVVNRPKGRFLDFFPNS